MHFLLSAFLLALLGVPGVSALAQPEGSVGRPATAASVTGTGFEELLLLPTVNQVAQSEPRLMVRDRQGQLWLAEDDLKAWRIRVPIGTPQV
ncbi:MAG: hypothetical protein ACK44L_07305, partial [Burkholderiales bacterium]